jgi:hypothetical protein
MLSHSRPVHLSSTTVFAIRLRHEIGSMSMAIQHASEAERAALLFSKKRTVYRCLA